MFRYHSWLEKHKYKHFSSSSIQEFKIAYYTQNVQLNVWASIHIDETGSKTHDS